MPSVASHPVRGQLSAAGILIGCAGCVVITASSVYTALKMGSLPWPTIFTSITALVLLRAMGRTSLNEANVTQIIMSAGSMVAGGLAFTVPGIWILGAADTTTFGEMLAVALTGTLLGLVATALIRKRFVEDSDLEYPIGTAAAETLLASRDFASTGKRLFGSMAAAGVWAVLRDVLGAIPSLVAQVPVPGVAFGIQCSPMRWAVGFLAGRRSMLWWAAGAVFGWLGIVALGSMAGLWGADTAQGIVQSLGMGLMMGSGAGVVLKDVIWPPLSKRLSRGVGTVSSAALGQPCSHGGATGASGSYGTRDEEEAVPKTFRDVSSVGTEGFFGHLRRADRGLLGLMAAVAALIICIALGLGPVAAIVMVLLSFVTAAMSAQSVGESGIDPMEIFGLIVLLFVAAFSDVSQVQLFFVAGVIAVACGLAGDVMSDFKTGQIIGTDPRVMWVGQAVGAILGTVVAAVVLQALLAAYGPDAFGTDALFVSAQANVVATMVAGVPSAPGFMAGLVAGCALYCAGIPAMMLGLGVYLPFYMTLSTVLGAGVRLAYDLLARRQGTDGDAAEESGVVVASGLLGGESIVGVIVAFASVIQGLAR